MLEEKKNQRKLSVQEIAKNPNIEIAANRDLGNLFEDWTAKVYFVNRHEQLFDMLQFGRVEYIAVVFPDALRLFNIYKNKTRIVGPIVISSEKLACKKSTDPTYINSFNGMIDRMRKNQQLQKLLGDCYFDSSQLE